ncbi:MAG: hypothetical protein Q9214_004735 [Letrouitia sp. 1 TL-2023]
MSASPKRSKFAEAGQSHLLYHQRYNPSPSAHSTTSKQSPPLNKSVKSKHQEQRRNIQTPPSNTEAELSRASLQLGSDVRPVREGSIDDLSSNVQDSPEAHQLTSGAPGVARRAKAHVPSACVNCKRKHLACETKRPCNRCLQNGKEATCVDVQHKKRGRPRLREEETLREVGLGSEYNHAEAYASQSGMMPITQPGRPRSKSYRELRSQPDNFYNSQRPWTSDSTYDNQTLQKASRFPISPQQAYISEGTPVALLTTDFRVAQHNYAFADALALHYSAKGNTLLDLVVPSEREKIQRLQTVLRAEMLDSAHLPPINGRLDSISSIPAIEDLDIGRATAGFHTRSEYWSFRLGGDRSRGFPISISLARGGGHFVVLTLVHSLSSSLPSSASLPSSHRSSHVPSPTSSQSIRSPTLDQFPLHGQHVNGSSGHYSAPLPLTVSKASADRTLLAHSHGLAQYRQTSPPQTAGLPYAVSRPGSSSEIPRSSPASYQDDRQRDSLKHLQLPPIRTSGSGIGEGKAERGGSSGKGTPVRGSPQSGRKKKRRRVDIGEMLH